MRAASRLLASVKPGQLLQPGTPTGLCGLRTHPSPRSTLLYLYNSTLEKLSQLPENSVYRQSTEALTKHRLKIIEATKPKGWDQWQERLGMILDEDPTGYNVKTYRVGKEIIVLDGFKQGLPDHRKKEKPKSMVPEGVRHVEDRRNFGARLSGADKGYEPEHDLKRPALDPEPMFTTDQVSYLESQFGAGLIEEVIQVAEDEHTLVDEMAKSKVWEPLEDSAPEGQWDYFERGMTHTQTQKP
ncbi:NADH-ubiquinone oxidoreductase 29.9 kd subunit precursor [Delitschia confertaspora ATCC 74209]|uniref:NADH-ubiquinone oxidoreductase 29.9 kd subunit n=1 Tax=Delitschia confertaspora ATCC 74209 TaxID=1513339 RepID=A0A9P4JFW3_9PLEO|nr:NADH-ubiquinone oxidoreductase 29.9 kd subunit precursor [Delitschia confertaspora ATCC 74209]